MNILQKITAYEKECQKHWDENTKIAHKRKDEETRLANERWRIENQQLDAEIDRKVKSIQNFFPNLFQKIFQSRKNKV